MGIYHVGALTYNSDYLMHHGILGQKWGVRRFQNSDGSLTEAGKQRYNPAPHVTGYPLDYKSPFIINNRLNTYYANARKTRIKENKHAKEYDKIQAKIRNVDPNSNKSYIVQDRLRLSEKKYVESVLERIGYLTLVDVTETKAVDNGYEIMKKIDLKNTQIGELPKVSFKVKKKT